MGSILQPVLCVTILLELPETMESTAQKDACKALPQQYSWITKRFETWSKWPLQSEDTASLLASDFQPGPVLDPRLGSGEGLKPIVVAA